jgi:putative ABC transport system ATP-binding protein
MSQNWRIVPRLQPPLLVIRALQKQYPRAGPLLHGLELELGAGEYVAIMGESGSGKSTLLNLIAGLEPADAGEILLDGVPIMSNDDACTRLRRRSMGFVFQAFHVLPYLSVIENVMLPLELLAVPRAERQHRAQAMLEACGIGALAARSPLELSGGELQRAAIARALVHRPRLVLADEPTGNLDTASAEHVLAVLRAQVKSEGAAGVLITHSAAAAATADRVLRLRDGQLVP